MPATHQRLYINIDHVATLRQARRTYEPDPVAAAALCEDAGADGITAHLREDRRHIRDDDVVRLSREVRTVFNLEMALTDEILDIAERLHPYQVTFVPERREEVTTEGGLDVSHDSVRLASGIERLKRSGLRISLFIDPLPEAVERSCELGADAVELHTGAYANNDMSRATLEALRVAAARSAELGLAVHAGHGLTLRNVAPVAAIPEIEELNIGHSIVSRAVFVGLAEAVREMRAAMDSARSGDGR
ncbi:MAG TPA: pyridoxine 5'-phosphate synthase [Gemmatimonadaceae bacterium]